MDLKKPVIPPPFSESESVTHQSKKDELYAAFIGKKYQSYYQEKFQNLEALKPKGGFNIAAFFIGPIWLFYRKMYAYGFIYIAFMIIYGIFADFVEISDSTDRAISIAVAVTLGLSGNGLYKNFVDKKLTTSVRGIEEAQEQGGTNPVLAWSLFVLIILLIGVGIFYGG